ncbi:MAG: hypothetical protein K0Q55_3880 [Verrucomicrobia bacterium]|jgi:hypothetical protein|nr:hypothetical protein [Verrucomicrobiota bacterium]
MDKIVSPEIVEIAPVYVAAGLVLALFFIVQRFEKRLLPLSPVSAISFATNITWFTFGVALFITSVPILKPFGFVLIFLGLAPLVADGFFAACFPLFFTLLGYGLLTLINELTNGKELYHPSMKPTLWFACITVVFWAVGLRFAFLRWRTSQPKDLPPALPPNV